MGVIDRSAAALSRGFFALALPLFAAVDVDAQGVTTAGIRGQLRAELRPQVDARIRVSHDPTGHAVEVHAPSGRFVIEGLEPGGPYTVSVRALGFAPWTRAGIHLTMGELREIDVVLRPVATKLDTMRAVVVQGVRADGGTGTFLTERSLDRLPTLNRDLYDFVRLVPQISTKISLASPGFSAGGMGFRFNNFLINGVSERTFGGSVSSAAAGIRSVPLDAVREYQVLLAPYDVRYGDFAGAFVNTVTRSGTNTVQGSLFAYGRSDRLGRPSAAGRTPYEQAQIGFSVGGPIVPDRLHVFVASELQHLTSPADGPYVGRSRPLQLMQLGEATLHAPLGPRPVHRAHANVRAECGLGGSDRESNSPAQSLRANRSGAAVLEQSGGGLGQLRRQRRHHVHPRRTRHLLALQHARDARFDGAHERAARPHQPAPRRGRAQRASAVAAHGRRRTARRGGSTDRTRGGACGVGHARYAE